MCSFNLFRRQYDILESRKRKNIFPKKIPDYYFNTHFENPEKEAPQKRSLFLV